MFRKHGVLPSTRLRAIQMMMQLNDLPWDTAERIESGLQRFSTVGTYVNNAKRVCHNVHFHPKLLSEDAIPLDELAAATNDQLLGPALRRFQEEELQRAQAIGHMMKERYDSVNALSLQSSALKCRNCHSADIAWQQKQTRGADEAMTIFCTCGSCGNRWKMS